MPLNKQAFFSLNANNQVWVWLCSLLIILSSPTLSAESVVVATEKEATAVIYLIRHAEKPSTNDHDPALTSQGERRAEFYARLWGEASNVTLYSTDYQRTRATLAPLSRVHHQTVIVYDPRRLDQLAEQLKRHSGTAVVVGHSNTTPQLAHLLGAPLMPMNEQEYDRITQVIITDGQLVAWQWLRGPSLTP